MSPVSSWYKKVSASVLSMEKKRYFYEMQILRVVDGDTFDVRVDLGFAITTWQRIRLMHVNTPEIRGVERLSGLAVKEYVKTLIEGKTLLAETFKQGKYGRYLADFKLENGEWLSKHLVDKGMAKEVTY